MSVKSYVLKVSLPSKEQIVKVKECNWENVCVKTGVSKVPWHPDNSSFPCFKPLEAYGVKMLLPRDTVDIKKVCKAHNINPDEVIDCVASLTGFTLVIGNGKNATKKHFTYMDVYRFREISDDSVLLLNEELIVSWNGDKAIAEYFSKRYTVRENLYVEISMKDLEYIRETIDPSIDIPIVREGEGLFYLEFC